MPYQYRNPRHYRYTPPPAPRRLFVPIIAVAVMGIVGLSYIESQIAQNKAAAESAKKLQVQKVARQAGVAVRTEAVTQIAQAALTVCGW